MLSPFKYRVRYTKLGGVAFLGSIETLDAMRRAFRAAGLKLKYSQGYHPRPKISGGAALPVGIESECEFVDIETVEAIEKEKLINDSQGHLPFGMKVVSIEELLPAAKSIEDSIVLTKYEVGIKDDVGAMIDCFKCAGKWPFTRRRKDKEEIVDLKDYVSHLAVLNHGVVGISVQNKKPILRIVEIVGGIFNLSEEILKCVSIRKVGIDFIDCHPCEGRDPVFI